jgi:chromosome partitioning protein
MKGGVGKTTLAVNLAWQLHNDGPANVLLIDLDPQFNATQYVMDYKAFEAHQKKNGTICDFLLEQPKFKLKKGTKGKQSVAKALHTVRETNGKKLQLLPADLGLARVVKNPSQSDFKLEKLLAGVRDKFDYVIIDCAPTDSVLTTMALNASDYLLIPVKPDRFSILGLTNLLETVDAFRTNCEDPHGVQVAGVVFTQVLSDQDLEAEAIAEVTAAAQQEGVYLFGSRLRHTRSFMRSVKDQKPIFETLYARQSRRFEVSDIADELKQQLAAKKLKNQTKKATKVKK